MGLQKRWKNGRKKVGLSQILYYIGLREGGKGRDYLNEYKSCEVCGRKATQIHHRVFRSKVHALVKCEFNYCYLCTDCHVKVHSRDGHELDLKLKLELQNKLETLFDKEYLTEDEINSVLQIGPTALKKLLKTLKRKPEGYFYLDVLRVCMGGRLYE